VTVAFWWNRDSDLLLVVPPKNRESDRLLAVGELCRFGGRGSVLGGCVKPCVRGREQTAAALAGRGFDVQIADNARQLVLDAIPEGAEVPHSVI
jgi:hypothetical protein